ncbi:unnamed protein product [Adineta ricciae]|uniref:Uncharacterized protein n=1 Tax=Adineta ricciae TaxID=249248 RepID=A0A816CM83_ADIRI|nr:unnamed protein product [Adineta ricciae]
MRKTVSLVISLLLLRLVQLSSNSQVFYNQPRFCNRSDWATRGNRVWYNSLDWGWTPNDIFVGIDDRIYTCCYYNKLVTISCELWYDWFKCSPRWLNVASSDKINSLFVTLQGIYLSEDKKKIIEFFPFANLHNKTTIGQNHDEPCYRLFVDINNTIYCSIRKKHIVVKRQPESSDQSWTIAAGKNNSKHSSSPDELNEPHGIFVDNSLGLYVADCKNNRIQLFKHGSRMGVTVFNTTKINCPSDITLDYDSNLYIVDSGNSRIILVKSDYSQYRCLIGCENNKHYLGKSLQYLSTMSFDRYGNIYDIDAGRKQILKYNLETSKCGE